MRGYKKLPEHIQSKFKIKEKIFIHNQYDPVLGIHKLKGRLSGLLSMKIDFRYRAIFEFLDDHKVLFLSIGTHDIYE